MASASFGRKGLPSTANIAEPAQRRSFGQAGADADPLADRRAAFLASERARAAEAGEPDMARSGLAEPRSARRAAPLPGERSLATAYILWFFLGGFSAHRFYLGAPLSGIAQVSLWYVSLMFWMAGNGAAFYPLAAGWLWIFADAVAIPKLREAANERARRRAERQEPEPVSPQPQEQ